MVMTCRLCEARRAFGVTQLRSGGLRGSLRTCELEPDMRRALVNAPTARHGVDDMKTASAHVVGTALSHLSLEAAPLVDHLPENTIALDTDDQRDGALTVRDGVGDKLRDHERQVACPLATEFVDEPVIEGLASDAGRRVVARQA